MYNIHRLIARLASTSLNTNSTVKNKVQSHRIISSRVFSAKSGGGGDEGKEEWEKAFSGSDDLGWDTMSSWSTGLTKEHFDGEAVGHRTTSSADSGGPGGNGGLDATQTALVSSLQEFDDKMRELEAENKKGKAFVDGWGERMQEMSILLKQVREPGARGSYLKDSEKAEMYRLHKENPEVYTIERLAKDYRIMRQRVHAILWLKELEEEEEKKLGRPLDDSVELLLDSFPEYYIPNYDPFDLF